MHFRTFFKLAAERTPLTAVVSRYILHIDMPYDRNRDYPWHLDLELRTESGLPRVGVRDVAARHLGGRIRVFKYHKIRFR